MNRIEQLREYVDKILLGNKDNYDRRCGYVHLYGVAQSAVILAKKRNLNVELAAMSAMLHDLYSYQYGIYENHGENGAVIAREILTQLNIASPEEIDIICTAIHHHSRKETIDGEYDELLKDADVLQHCTYNPLHPIKDNEKARYEKLLLELGI